MQRARHSLQRTPTTILSETHPISSLLRSTTSSHLCSGGHHPEKSLTRFLAAQRRGLTPDRFTIPSLLKLSPHPLHAQHLHALSLKSGHTHDLFISTSLAEAYFNHGLLDAPRHLFDEIPHRDVVFFTALICGFSKNGLSDKALRFFYIMIEESINPNRITVATVLSVCSQLRELELGKVLHGFSLRSSLLDEFDVVFQTALVDMYTKCGRLGYAKEVFDGMRERNLASWNSIISAYFSNGPFETALGMFMDMILEGRQRPRSSTIVLVLDICKITTDLRKGKEIHGCVIKSTGCRSNEVDSIAECNAVIDMYVKTGSLESAIMVFESMLERDVITWTVMISGYGAYGFSIKALDTFYGMEDSGIRPDGVVFLCILSACSHGGLVDEGRQLYFSMQRDYDIVPEMKHFACMVDLYGRAGLLQEAFDFIKAIPVEPSKIVWGTLLSHCRSHKNLQLGEYAAKKSLEIDQHDVGNYVLLSRLYADAGRWEDFAKVRSVMNKHGLNPDTACSWVEVKGIVYRFTVSDHSKPFSKRIYAFVEKLGLVIEKAGFILDTSNVSRNVNEEKLSDLCCHTEKLALAFMLMKDRGSGLIRIWKNLRVCRDCHEAFKYISMLINRDIILKDPNRYHRFGRGFCSCHDYW